MYSTPNISPKTEIIISITRKRCVLRYKLKETLLKVTKGRQPY